MDAYSIYLREHKDETKELFKDMLIGVTSFFREPNSWIDLEKLVFKPSLKDINSDLPFRVWIPGCASGEEAYTTAMVILENMPAGNQRDFQIFATDIDKNALDIARIGRYPVNIAADVAPRCLKNISIKKMSFIRLVINYAITSFFPNKISLVFRLFQN